MISFIADAYYANLAADMGGYGPGHGFPGTANGYRTPPGQHAATDLNFATQHMRPAPAVVLPLLPYNATSLA